MESRTKRFFLWLRDWIKAIVTLAVIVFAVLFVMNGGLARFGIGSPTGFSFSGSSGETNQEKLTRFLAGQNVRVTHVSPYGHGQQYSLMWSVADANYGAAALQRAQSGLIIRAYQPTGLNNVDQRYEKGQQVYIGRFQVQF
jgi:hypothetical protein